MEMDMFFTFFCVTTCNVAASYWPKLPTYCDISYTMLTLHVVHLAQRPLKPNGQKKMFAYMEELWVKKKKKKFTQTSLSVYEKVGDKILDGWILWHCSKCCRTFSHIRPNRARRKTKKKGRTCPPFAGLLDPFSSTCLFLIILASV